MYTTMCNDAYTVQAVDGSNNMAVFSDSCTNTVNVYQRFTTVL